MPPIWAVVETMSLGTLSRWFKSTKATAVKNEVARSFGMPKIEIFEQVLHALTPIRNICAHHGRLWNRRLILQLPNIKRLIHEMVIETVPSTSGTPQKQAARQVYNYLLVLAHLMKPINPGTSWIRRLASHVQTIPVAQQQAMGFPGGWQSMNIWR